MKTRLLIVALSGLLLSLSARASLGDDTITTSYGGFLIGFSGGPPAPVNTTFAAGPIDVSFTDPFDQHWVATTDFSNGNQLDVSFATPGNTFGNVSSMADLFIVNYSFASTGIETVKLTGFGYDPGNPSAIPWPSNHTRLGSITRTGDNSFQLAFNYLITGDSYRFSITPTPVPEPETYAMMMAGLGLLGFVARRKKTQQGMPLT